VGGADDDIAPILLALHERALLLVLDNFEQLVEQAADIVARLAAALPRLRLMVTSRRALGLDGERALPVPALALPEAERAVPLAEALANPAVALFVDRARHVRADFHLGEHNKQAVLDLVRALEGLPLAIELAASRVKSLGPARILELLAAGDSPRLELLARSGPRSALDARHASMERAIRWSWQQLSAEEASLMHALAMFGGGCTVAAAAAVRGIAPLAAALRLDALVACSMLRTTAMPSGDLRFAMYEPIREFALVELRQSGAAGAEAGLRAAHRAWMLEWAEALPSTPSLPALRAELPNLSTALHSALADGDAMSALRTVLALGRAHDDLVLGPDSLASLEQAVARCDDAELRSRGHTQLAQLLFAAGRGDAARRHAELGLEQVPDEPGLRARALQVKARLHWLLVGHSAWLEPSVDEAEALARAAHDTQVLARLTVLRAAISYAHHRDLVQGEALYRQALAMWERLGTQHDINAGRYFVALMAHEAGRHEEAIQRADEVAASARQLADPRRASQALQVRGKALAALRRWQEAAATLHESIQLAWDAMAPVELTRALRELPRVLAHLRRAEAAVRLQAYAAQAARAHVGRADTFDAEQEMRVRRLVAGRITPGRMEALRREGAALGTAEAVAMALAESAGG
jgi:predicted ATPase